MNKFRAKVQLPSGKVAPVEVTTDNVTSAVGLLEMLYSGNVLTIPEKVGGDE